MLLSQTYYGQLKLHGIREPEETHLSRGKRTGIFVYAPITHLLSALVGDI